MPDIFGASGQFSIDALGAQNQAALNNAYGSGGFGGSVGQYAPYPMFGGPIDTWQPPPQPGGSPGSDVSTQNYLRQLQGTGSRGAPSYNPYSSQTYAPQMPSWFGNLGGGGGGYNPYQNNNAPATFDQRFPASSGVNPDFTWRGPDPLTPQQYAQFIGAQQSSMSMNPYLSMGGRPNMQAPNIDPNFEYNPYNPNQPQGFEQYRTRDQNIINPDIQNWQRQDPYNLGPRDQIASALMRQQVALGVS